MYVFSVNKTLAKPTNVLKHASLANAKFGE
jgi:hypothetical protein